MESGCGIAPIKYRNKSLVHAMQWAIGLEWYLLVNDPWRIAMSTDHPNGGSFLAYPEIVALLMDREKRRAIYSQVQKILARDLPYVSLWHEHNIAVLKRGTVGYHTTPNARFEALKSAHAGSGLSQMCAMRLEPTAK